MMHEIETARLRLRMFTMDDVDAHYRAIESDPDVMRYLPAGEALPKERTEKTVRYFIAYWDQHGMGFWAVIHKTDATFIGHCGLQYIPETPDVEVAYALAKPYWGQGLATEAAHACLRYGFEQLKLEQIVAVAYPENVASQRVMIKIGMTYEKIAHVYNMDLPYYVINCEAFQAGDAPYSLHALS